MQSPCSPRFNWQECPLEWKNSFVVFYTVTLVAHLITLVAYTVIFYLRWRKEQILSFKEYLNLLTTKITIGVIFYSLMISINHISLLTEKPILPDSINEITFNAYNVGIFLTLMLLIRFWAVLPLSLSPLVATYALISRVAFYVTGAITAAFVITTDLVMFILPESVDLMIDLQYGMWGMACLLNGILFCVCGYRLLSSSQSSWNDKTEKTPEEKQLFFKFKAIYYFYVIVSPFYAALYFVAIYGGNQLAIWLIVYSIFNLAGPLSAAILAPVFLT